MDHEKSKEKLNVDVIDWLRDRGVTQRSKVIAFLDFIKSDALEVLSDLPCFERAASKVAQCHKSDVHGFVERLAQIENKRWESKTLFKEEDPVWKKEGYPSSKAYKAVMGDE